MHPTPLNHTALPRLVLFVAAILLLATAIPARAELRAGVSRVDVTDVEAGPVNDPLYVKALVIQDGTTTAVIITVDAVAIAEIGTIRNEFLSNVRAQLEKELGIPPASVLVNASHCHGRVCADIEQRTVQAVRTAAASLVPVRVGAGTGQEDRVMENRRLKLKNGREADVRHAYSLPPDAEVAAVGPVDPEIGVLRLDREDGKPLAIVYNFACHPIQGVPSGGNTADMIGFASGVLEEAFGNGCVALFLQGCGGDVNPIGYKDIDHPRDAEPLGHLLGLSTLRAAQSVTTRAEARFRLVNETLALPRADLAGTIESLESEQAQLVRSLKGTSLNLKSFLALVTKHGLATTFPSSASHRYLHERQLGRDHLEKLDAEHRRNIEQYLQNVYTMEELTRVQTNLALLKKHQASLIAAGRRTIDVELVGLRLGDFVLVTSPGELTVPIGLNIKKASPHDLTFVAGYTNGYIYYAPTAEQLKNRGHAQEDSDCLLAPEWQEIFETRAVEVLKGL